MSCICEKCKHFIQHYSFESGFARKLYCGHCMKHDRHYKLSSSHTKCEQFESKDNLTTKEIIHKKIINALNDIQYKINDLKQYIQKDA